jgi:hypothetical protein
VRERKEKVKERKTCPEKKATQRQGQKRRLPWVLKIEFLAGGRRCCCSQPDNKQKENEQAVESDIEGNERGRERERERHRERQRERERERQKQAKKECERKPTSCCGVPTGSMGPNLPSRAFLYLGKRAGVRAINRKPLSDWHV